MTAKNREEHPKAQDKSREKILTAAFELFARRGYAQTSVDSIAAKAAVSKGLIYHYFDSKEHILKGVFDRMKEEGDTLMKGIERLPPEKFLKKMIEQSIEFIVRQRETFRLMIALSVQSEVAEGLAEEIEEVRNEWLSALVKVFEALGYDDPETEAYLLSALLDGVGIGYCVIPPEYPLEKVRRLIEKRYCSTGK